MANSLVFSLSATLSLLPAVLLFNRGPARRDAQFWALLAVAMAGSGIWAVAQASDGWHTGFEAAMWVSITASLSVFGLLAIFLEHVWRLGGLLTAYLFVLAASATVWSQAAQGPIVGPAPPLWLLLHIGASVLTYALLTIGAIAGISVLLHERALKQKQRGPLIDRLPSMADSERLEVGLIVAAELVLGVGILTGMTIEYLSSGKLLVFDHKTIFVVAAFVVIGALLAAHFLVGLRGRRAARFVLLAYLLVTLGYPGVKFVSDILLG